MPASPELALEASVQRTDSGGWRVRLPVRREEVCVEKVTVVTEEVDIRLERIETVDRLDADLRQEELVVDTHGDVEKAPPDAGGAPHS
jgi:uncharacterized protein (TIGR02271 family)